MPDFVGATPEGTDVIVVGASAAGLFLATRLARKGLRTVVLEAAAAVDPLPRSLIVTAQLLDVAGSAGAASVINDIDTFELVAGGRTTRIPLARPDLIIDRARLVRALLGEAVEAGVDVRVGHRVVGIEAGSPPAVIAVVSGTRTTMRATHVVGADGAFSKVAQFAGWAARPTAPLIQAIVELPADVAPRVSRVWFVPEDTPYFYWLIPDGPGRGALGVIGEDGARTRRALDRFLVRESFAPIEYQAARIPIYSGWMPVSRRVGAGWVHLVGDAAGHVKVTTVGGIVTGLRSADAVAGFIADGRRGPIRAARLELDTHLWIRRALHRFESADYVRLIDLLNGSVRRTLGAVTRDEAASLAIRLVASQPQLAWLALRGLTTSGGVRSLLTPAPTAASRGFSMTGARAASPDGSAGQ